MQALGVAGGWSTHRLGRRTVSTTAACRVRIFLDRDTFLTLIIFLLNFLVQPPHPAFSPDLPTKPFYSTFSLKSLTSNIIYPDTKSQLFTMAEPVLQTRYYGATNGSWIPLSDQSQPKNILHQHLLEAADEFSISSFDAHTLDIFIQVSRDNDGVSDLMAFDFDFYPNPEHNRTLFARFHEGQAQVLIDKWVPLIDYLEQVSRNNILNPNQSTSFCQATGIQAQNAWWNARRNAKIKEFPFLELPLELRREIYRFAAPQDAIEPYPSHDLRGSYRKNGLPRVSAGNYNWARGLLRVNKLVHQEMSEYLYSNVPVLFNHHLLLEKTFPKNTLFLGERLTQLTLALPTPRDFVKLFGLNGRNLIADEEFIFEPKEQTISCLGREHLSLIKKIEIIIPPCEQYDHRLKSYCQTHIATMILETMWSTIYGHPLVVSGRVKKWQKKYWEEAAAQAHKEYEEVHADTEDGGVRVTQEDIDIYEGKADGHDYDKDGNCCDCALSGCSLHNDDEESDDEEEYLFPFLCACHPPCTYDSEWTDVDVVKDLEDEEGED